jgi:hypothetical protein
MRICYVESRDSDAYVLSESSADDRSLSDAIAHAEARIRDFGLTPPSPAWPLAITGFVIYDDAGQELHRQYIEGK